MGIGPVLVAPGSPDPAQDVSSGSRVSTYFGAANWPAEILPYWIKELLKLCQPRTFSPGKRVFKPARMLRYKFRAFSPVGRASNSIPGTPKDQANSSGLSLKPALTGFSPM
jgi:hypothetical protein